MEGIASLWELATDGLWARLRDGRKRVALMVADSVSGLVYPPVVVANEESADSWEALFTRLEGAGVSLEQINGLVSDGARGLLSYLQQKLAWVHQQRCVPQLPLGLASVAQPGGPDRATGEGRGHRDARPVPQPSVHCI
jgi:hypothetical protein